jgi:hypothetical protein
MDASLLPISELADLIEGILAMHDARTPDGIMTMEQWPQNRGAVRAAEVVRLRRSA